MIICQPPISDDKAVSNTPKISPDKIHLDKIRLDKICQDYDGRPLLQDIDLSVANGEIVAIVGASGVGKTTLFNIAAGLIEPKAGSVMINGRDTTGQSGYVGYMQQKDLLLPFYDIYKNVAMPLIIKGCDAAFIRQAIFDNAAAFGLSELLQKYPAQLSGGQRQRAALLRTYLSNNDVMLLDEPFSALDFITKNQMYDWFASFCQKSHLTCLIITHDVEEAILLADSVYVLAGSPADFVARFDVPKTPNFLQSQEFLQLKQRILDSQITH